MSNIENIQETQKGLRRKHDVQAAINKAADQRRAEQEAKAEAYDRELERLLVKNKQLIIDTVERVRDGKYTSVEKISTIPHCLDVLWEAKRQFEALGNYANTSAIKRVAWWIKQRFERISNPKVTTPKIGDYVLAKAGEQI